MNTTLPRIHLFTRRPGFPALAFGLINLAMFAGFIVLTAGAVLLAGVLTPALIGFIIVANLYGIAALLVNFILFKPAYMRGFPVTPFHMARVLVWLGGSLMLLRAIVRQPTLEGRLEIMLAGVFAALITVAALETAILAYRKRYREVLRRPVLAYAILAAGTLFALLMVPRIFASQTRVDQLLIMLALLTLNGLMAQGMLVLDLLSTPPFKTVSLAEHEAAVVFHRDRIQNILFKSPAEVMIRHGKLQKIDLRVHTATIEHECESLDQAHVRLQITYLWQPIAEAEAIRKYLLYAREPELTLERQVKSLLTNEIGSRYSEFISGREDAIGSAVLARIESQARQFGMKVVSVTLMRVQIKFPSATEGLSPRLEASRLRNLDTAVREVAPETLQHVEKLSKAQRVAASQEDRSYPNPYSINSGN
jgi:hypothetical protein